MSVAQLPGSMYPTDTKSPGPAMRNMRCHSGDPAEINTLPRTSEGQKGAVAVTGRRGSLNKTTLSWRAAAAPIWVNSGRPTPWTAISRSRTR
jgi:hypothetical protein